MYIYFQEGALDGRVDPRRVLLFSGGRRLSEERRQSLRGPGHQPSVRHRCRAERPVLPVHTTQPDPVQVNGGAGADRHTD